ncbi:MAG: S41 family peptidase [Alistipes sp.]|nr:S41 family peptidase [Alistipes sp.]
MKRGIIITLILNVMLSLLPFAVQAQRTDAAVVQLQKLNRVYRYLYNSYVDSVDMESMVESGIKAMLEELDPHSVYLDKKEMKAAQETMEGEFSGIGVEYNVLNDTIVVVNTVQHGPAERVGVMPSDRIVEIDGKGVVGIERSDVSPLLRGEKGSMVSVGVVRRGVNEMLHFSITRDMIPITTVDAVYKISDSVGYVKVNRFGRTTMQEFEDAMSQLGDIDALVLDLSNNGGGLLDQAVEMAGYFIPRDSLVVSTEGRSVEPRYYYAKDGGRFNGRLVVMINESSASGSEIVAGAIQDWDRGVVVGRESFGKGLVQSQIPLGDGSAIRLTIARYHTPSGRVIQRPYKNGEKEEYHKAYVNRLRGAVDDADQQRPMFKTLRLRRDVYAGGGIRPDVVVQSDTTKVGDYMVKVVAKGVYNEFVLDYIDRSRDDLVVRYADFGQFDREFHLSDDEMRHLIERASAKGVEYDEAGYKQSQELMRVQLTALIAQRLFSTTEYYRYINPRLNDSYKKAINILSSDDAGFGNLLKVE